jgi:hypothetical protein
MRCGISLTFALASACLACACTSTETSVTAPTVDKCQITVSGAPSTFGADGGTGAVAIVTARDCTWSISTTANWVALKGDHTGQGEASIPYTVAPNPVPSARSGAIVVGSHSVQLSQAAAPCRFTLSRNGAEIGFGGGALSVDVSTLTGCAWNTTSRVNWIAVASGQTENASATVKLNVNANNGAVRVGQVNVAGQNYIVTQNGTPPPPAPPPPSPPPAPQPPAPPPPGPAPVPPPPQGGQTMDFSGAIASLSGGCPSLTFVVSGRTVITDQSTKFKGGLSCDEVERGMRVSGDGVTDSAGAIHANTVKKAG